MKKRVFYLLAVCFFSAVFISCSTTKARQDDFESIYFDSDGFYQTSLSNGINLIMKRSGPAQICALRIYFVGGSSVQSAEFSGLDDVAFEMMSRGGKKYNYEAIQKVLYDETASYGASGGRDASYIGFRCIKHSFSKMLEILADCVLTPSFNPEDFEIVMQEEKASLQNRLNDPSSVVVSMIENSVYKETCYETDDAVTETSIENVTLEKIVETHAALLNANRIFIAASGNFFDNDVKELVKKLNKSFGKIGASDFEVGEVGEFNFEPSVEFKPLEVAGDSGYIMGYFPAPERTAEDYVPFAISTMILDEILFEKVREEKGAVYSIGMGALTSRKTVGILSVYRASEKSKLKGYIESAVALFPDEAKIEEKLEEYKNKYITTLYENNQTVSAACGSIAASKIYFENPKAHLSRSEQVTATTAAQVREAYEKYIMMTGDWGWKIVSGVDGWVF